jgi:N,N'-diacetyllegionaminate synthase
MKTLIIAEAGVNHNGDLGLAIDLINAAADAGADYVKFQTFKSEEGLSKHAVQADYQLINTGQKETQLEMVQRLELKQEDHYQLIDHCEKRGIKFLSTGFDIPSIIFLRSLNLDMFKIPSGEITNLPLLRLIAGYNSTIILSTGMSTLNDIEAAINVLVQNGTEKTNITILHCTTEYPAPFEEINLRVLSTIRDRFNLNVGYSDHSLGILVPVSAVALGATVIEKHFTLDQNLPGPDHKASLEPDQLKQMVDSIRDVEVILGSAEKIVTASEKKNSLVARKSLVAKRAIKKGDMFSEDNITAKRPGTGISPMRYDEALTIRAPRDFQPDDLIEFSGT